MIDRMIWLPYWNLERLVLVLVGLFFIPNVFVHLDAQDFELPNLEKAVLVFEGPESGAVFEAPATIRFTVVAVDPDGDIRRVSFFVNDEKLGESVHLTRDAIIPGRPRTHVFEWDGVTAGDYRVHATARATNGSRVESEPIVVLVEEEAVRGVRLVEKGATWRYRNDGDDLGQEWIDPDFDDDDWPSGPAQLGYGDGDEATVTRPGENPPPRPITAYFRHTFEIEDGAEFAGLLLRLLRDDGAAVHLNGTEIVRSNLPEGDLTFETRAVETMGGNNERRYHEFAVDPTRVRVGRNVIAVEIHQANPTSSDISFDLELIGLDELPPKELPVVGIRSATAETAEPAPNIRIRPGVFVVFRDGSVDEALTVFLKQDGSATPGKDYEALPEMVKIPAGREAIELLVKPLDDDEIEPDEFVFIGIDEPAGEWEGSYHVDPERSLARVVIHDTDRPHAAATLKVTSPENGDEFPPETPIVINATAIDPRGYISRIEFWDGEERIGASEIVFFQAPDPGTPIHHTIEWIGAAAGEHRLRARAEDSAGKLVVSAPVEIVVGEINEEAFFRRELPPAYAPGRTIKVEIRAQPSRRTGAYAVEDIPPEGWRILEISHEGVFDRLTGKVKFGPFTNTRARTLSYYARAPGDATGIHEFSGIGSIDGKPFRIVGDRRIEPVSEYHPADHSPRDFEISITELTGYSGAWKLGREWPFGPVPIPLSYVTRAGALWRDGEIYRFEPEAGEAPLWWVSASADEVAAASEIADAGPNTAWRTIQRATDGDEAVTISIEVSPLEGTEAYAVEEVPPAAGTVEAIDSGGEFDPATGTIRWGLFMDDQARTVSYRFLPALNAFRSDAFFGWASFEGMKIWVEGDSLIGDEPRGEIRVVDITRLPNGHIQLILQGNPPDENYRLEISTDLEHWSERGAFQAGDASYFFIDENASEQGSLFYRAVASP